MRELILSTNHDVQNSALSLSLLVLTSTIARNQALERPFLRAIAQALRCHDVSVMQSACRVLLLLGSENQAELRQKMFDVTATRSSQKDTIRDEDLLITTTTLNTVTDEGSANTDADSAYLATTVERLVDLVAGKIVSVQEPDVSLGLSQVSVVMPEEELAKSLQLRKELGGLCNKASEVLAGMTNGDESDWPDGAPPLRQTLRQANVLPSIHSV